METKQNHTQPFAMTRFSLKKKKKKKFFNLKYPKSNLKVII